MTTLGYAILGLLSREDLSGYDLKQRMAGRVGYFWSAKHSQIYPELARLEDGGYVKHSVVEQRERPDKKVYEITAEGLDALKEWVIQPPVPRPTRDELTLKTYSVWLADEEKAAQLFVKRTQARGAARALRGATGLDGGRVARGADLYQQPRVRLLRYAPARHQLRERIC